MRIDPDELIENLSDLMQMSEEMQKRDLTRRRASSYFQKSTGPDESDDDLAEAADNVDDDEPGPALRAIRRRLRGGKRPADAGDEEGDDASHTLKEDAGDEVGMIQKIDDDELRALRVLAETGDVAARLLLHEIGKTAVAACIRQPRCDFFPGRRSE